MFQYTKLIIYKYAELILLPFFLLIYLIIIVVKKNNKQDKPRLIWGADPIIINKYWSDCMNAQGYVSKTLMSGFYASINKKEDFDLYVHDLAPIKLPQNFAAYYAFFYAIYNFDIIHHPAHGFLLRFTFWLNKCEGFFIKNAGCKNVVLPYGSDILLYSKINNLELRHALLLSYPNAGKKESQIQKQINYWINNSSVFLPALQTDGVGYWDVLCYNCTVIDEKKWTVKEDLSNQKDGIKDVVKIMHTPNHRGVKGTEFIIKAVKDLKAEGLKVELILLEKVNNEVVKATMNDVEILVEQLIFAHGLSAIEGMAKGLSVISNFEIGRAHV